MLICSENRSKISRIQPCQWVFVNHLFLLFRNYGTTMLLKCNIFILWKAIFEKKARRVRPSKKMYSWPEILVPFAWSQSRVSWDDLKTTTKKPPFWIAKKPKFLDSALGGKFCLNKYRYLHFQLCHQLHLKCQKVVVRMVEMSHFPLFFHKSIKQIYPPWN